MDPNTGHDGSLESAAEFMVSPDLGGKSLPGEEPEEAVDAEFTEVEKPETEAAAEEQHQPDQEAEGQETGQDETEPENTDAQEEPGDRYRVKVNGEETEVTLEELKQGYSGQKYVQQGMQEAAAARKEAEAIYTSLQNERRQVAEYFQQIQSGMTPPPVEPDKALFETDPLRYMDAKIKYDEQLSQYNAQVQELQQVTAQQQQADQQAMASYLTGELKQLQAIEPEFRDQETAGKLREQMLAKGNELYGYAPEEIAQIVDHRAIRVLRDAMRWHELQAGKESNLEKVQHKMVKGTKSKRQTTGESRRRKQREQFKRSGSIDDAVGLLFQ